MGRRQDIEAGRAFIRLGVKNELKKQLGGAIKTAAKTVAIGAAGIAAAATTAGVALGKMIGDFAEAGSALRKLSLQTGVSVEDLSRLQFAAKKSGVDVDDMSGAIEELNIRLGEFVRDGTGPAGEALATLGLDGKELAKLPLPERIGMIADALNRVKNNASRQFLADEIFGGDAFKILSVLRQGSEGIRQLTEEADRLGVTMSTQDAQAAADLSQAMTTLKEAIGAAGKEIAAGVLGNGDLAAGVEELAEKVAEIDWRGMATEATDAFTAITGGIEGVKAAIEGVDTLVTDLRVGFLRLEAIAREVFANLADSADIGAFLDQAIGLPAGTPNNVKQAIGLPAFGKRSTDEGRKQNRLRQAEVLAEIERLRREQTSRANRRSGPGLPGFEESDFGDIPEPSIDLSRGGGPSRGAIPSTRPKKRGFGAVAAFLEEATAAPSLPNGGPSGVTFSSAAASAAGFGSGRSPEKLMEDQLSALNSLVESGNKIVMGLTHG